MNSVEEKLEQYKKMSELINSLTEQKKVLGKEISELLNQESQVVGEYKVSFRSSKKFDTTEFKNDYPKLYEDYRRESSKTMYVVKSKEK